LRGGRRRGDGPRGRGGGEAPEIHDLGAVDVNYAEGLGLLEWDGDAAARGDRVAFACFVGTGDGHGRMCEVVARVVSGEWGGCLMGMGDEAEVIQGLGKSDRDAVGPGLKDVWAT
jgi:hypothetical protein